MASEEFRSAAQALAEDAPQRLSAIMAAGLRQHKAVAQFMRSVAEAANDLAIAAAAASGVDEKVDVEACTAPAMHVLQAYAAKLLTSNDEVQDAWKNTQSQHGHILDQYAANQRTLTSSQSWNEFKAMAPRVQRARERADACKETLILRCGGLANAIPLSEDEEDGTDEGRISKLSKVRAKAAMSEQEYRSAVQQLESHTQELNGKVNRVVDDLIHVERSAWDRAQSTMIDFLIQLQQWHEQNAAATAATIDRLRQLSLEQMLTSKSAKLSADEGLQRRASHTKILTVSNMVERIESLPEATLEARNQAAALSPKSRRATSPFTRTMMKWIPGLESPRRGSRSSTSESSVPKSFANGSASTTADGVLLVHPAPASLVDDGDRDDTLGQAPPPPPLVQDAADDNDEFDDSSSPEPPTNKLQFRIRSQKTVDPLTPVSDPSAPASALANDPWASPSIPANESPQTKDTESPAEAFLWGSAHQSEHQRSQDQLPGFRQSSSGSGRISSVNGDGEEDAEFDEDDDQPTSSDTARALLASTAGQPPSLSRLSAPHQSTGGESEFDLDDDGTQPPARLSTQNSARRLSQPLATRAAAALAASSREPSRMSPISPFYSPHASPPKLQQSLSRGSTDQQAEPLSAARGSAASLKELWLTRRGSEEKESAGRHSFSAGRRPSMEGGRRPQRRSIVAHENSVEELASPQSAVVRAVLRGIESIGSGVPIDAVATVVEIIDGTFVGKKLALATVTRSAQVSLAFQPEAIPKLQRAPAGTEIRFRLEHDESRGPLRNLQCLYDFVKFSEGLVSLQAAALAEILVALSQSQAQPVLELPVVRFGLSAEPTDAPLRIRVVWKCDYGMASVNAEYDCNPLLRMPLEDVTAEVVAPRAATQCTPKPYAVWDTSSGLLVWDLGSMGTGEHPRSGKLFARFSVAQRGEPSKLVVRFAVYGHNESGVVLHNDDTDGVRLRIKQVVYRMESGKYIAIPSS